jgi:hypothetical protein
MIQYYRINSLYLFTLSSNPLSEARSSGGMLLTANIISVTPAFDNASI